MPPTSLAFALSLAVAVLTAAAPGSLQGPVRWRLADSYNASNFFDKFDFYTGRSGDAGYARYQNRYDAERKGLILTDAHGVRIGPDARSVLKAPCEPDGSPGRDSVRIESKASYNRGLLIARFHRLPRMNCGMWPAFWTHGNDWPNDGEIDVLESFNLNSWSQPGFRTSNARGDCVLRAEPQKRHTSPLISESCTSEQGCYGADRRALIGHEAGAIFALEWTKAFIKIYRWIPGQEPADINTDTPIPSGWGPPLVSLLTSDCDIDAHFANQRIVLNLDFCGEGAGRPEAWRASCAGLTREENCADFVARNPQSFDEAYFHVRDIRYFDAEGVKPSLRSERFSVPGGTEGVRRPVPTSGGRKPTPAPDAGRKPSSTRTAGRKPASDRAPPRKQSSTPPAPKKPSTTSPAPENPAPTPAELRKKPTTPAAPMNPSSATAASKKSSPPRATPRKSSTPAGSRKSSTQAGSKKASTPAGSRKPSGGAESRLKTSAAASRRRPLGQAGSDEFSSASATSKRRPSSTPAPSRDSSTPAQSEKYSTLAPPKTSATPATPKKSSTPAQPKKPLTSATPKKPSTPVTPKKIPSPAPQKPKSTPPPRKPSTAKAPTTRGHKPVSGPPRNPPGKKTTKPVSSSGKTKAGDTASAPKTPAAKTPLSAPPSKQKPGNAKTGDAKTAGAKSAPPSKSPSPRSKPSPAKTASPSKAAPAKPSAPYPVSKDAAKDSSKGPAGKKPSSTPESGKAKTGGNRSGSAKGKVSSVYSAPKPTPAKTSSVPHIASPKNSGASKGSLAPGKKPSVSDKDSGSGKKKGGSESERGQGRSSTTPTAKATPAKTPAAPAATEQEGKVPFKGSSDFEKKPSTSGRAPGSGRTSAGGAKSESSKGKPSVPAQALAAAGKTSWTPAPKATTRGPGPAPIYEKESFGKGPGSVPKSGSDDVKTGTSVRSGPAASHPAAAKTSIPASAPSKTTGSPRMGSSGASGSANMIGDVKIGAAKSDLLEKPSTSLRSHQTPTKPSTRETSPSSEETAGTSGQVESDGVEFGNVKPGSLEGLAPTRQQATATSAWMQTSPSDKVRGAPEKTKTEDAKTDDARLGAAEGSVPSRTQASPADWSSQEQTSPLRQHIAHKGEVDAYEYQTGSSAEKPSAPITALPAVAQVSPAGRRTSSRVATAETMKTGGPEHDPSSVSRSAAPRTSARSQKAGVDNGSRTRKPLTSDQQESDDTGSGLSSASQNAASRISVSIDDNSPGNKPFSSGGISGSYREQKADAASVFSGVKPSPNLATPQPGVLRTSASTFKTVGRSGGKPLSTGQTLDSGKSETDGVKSERQEWPVGESSGLHTLASSPTSAGTGPDPSGRKPFPGQDPDSHQQKTGHEESGPPSWNDEDPILQQFKWESPVDTPQPGTRKTPPTPVQQNVGGFIEDSSSALLSSSAESNLPESSRTKRSSSLEPTEADFPKTRDLSHHLSPSHTKTTDSDLGSSGKGPPSTAAFHTPKETSRGSEPSGARGRYSLTPRPTFTAGSPGGVGVEHPGKRPSSEPRQSWERSMPSKSRSDSNARYTSDHQYGDTVVTVKLTTSSAPNSFERGPSTSGPSRARETNSGLRHDSSRRGMSAPPSSGATTYSLQGTSPGGKSSTPRLYLTPPKDETTSAPKPETSAIKLSAIPRFSLSSSIGEMVGGGKLPPTSRLSSTAEPKMPSFPAPTIEDTPFRPSETKLDQTPRLQIKGALKETIINPDTATQDRRPSTPRLTNSPPIDPQTGASSEITSASPRFSLSFRGPTDELASTFGGLSSTPTPESETTPKGYGVSSKTETDGQSPLYQMTTTSALKPGANPKTKKYHASIGESAGPYSYWPPPERLPATARSNGLEDIEAPEFKSVDSHSSSVTAARKHPGSDSGEFAGVRQSSHVPNDMDATAGYLSSMGTSDGKDSNPDLVDGKPASTQNLGTNDGRPTNRWSATGTDFESSITTDDTVKTSGSFLPQTVGSGSPPLTSTVSGGTLSLRPTRFGTADGGSASAEPSASTGFESSSMLSVSANNERQSNSNLVPGGTLREGFSRSQLGASSGSVATTAVLGSSTDASLSGDAGLKGQIMSSESLELGPALSSGRSGSASRSMATAAASRIDEVGRAGDSTRLAPEDSRHPKFMDSGMYSTESGMRSGSAASTELGGDASVSSGSSGAASSSSLADPISGIKDSAGRHVMTDSRVSAGSDGSSRVVFTSAPSTVPRQSTSSTGDVASRSLHAQVGSTPKAASPPETAGAQPPGSRTKLAVETLSIGPSGTRTAGNDMRASGQDDVSRTVAGGGVSDYSRASSGAQSPAESNSVSDTRAITHSQDQAYASDSIRSGRSWASGQSAAIAPSTTGPPRTFADSSVSASSISGGSQTTFEGPRASDHLKDSDDRSGTSGYSQNSGGSQITVDHLGTSGQYQDRASRFQKSTHTAVDSSRAAAHSQASSTLGVSSPTASAGSRAEDGFMTSSGFSTSVLSDGAAASSGAPAGHSGAPSHPEDSDSRFRKSSSPAADRPKSSDSSQALSDSGSSASTASAGFGVQDASMPSGVSLASALPTATPSVSGNSRAAAVRSGAPVRPQDSDVEASSGSSGHSQGSTDRSKGLSYSATDRSGDSWASSTWVGSAASKASASSRVEGSSASGGPPASALSGTATPAAGRFWATSVRSEASSHSQDSDGRASEVPDRSRTLDDSAASFTARGSAASTASAGSPALSDSQTSVDSLASAQSGDAASSGVSDNSEKFLSRLLSTRTPQLARKRHRTHLWTASLFMPVTPALSTLRLWDPLSHTLLMILAIRFSLLIPALL
ncbi:glycoside hydrolase family 16 protein [Ophiocordyceps camponoti-floridani]|uniref:Glycoside hydrolase family 16 protein n=1 Tax=Ophiocordyceps camponoti-floridani TaxID=2030778 RepID=A0A8H4VBX0_9HYPO|nr:glycoside hydrolase family 16 protein [Ophiocordyceps camponoti-floridani]